MKCKLGILTKDLKELLMKKELTARARQDDGPSSPNYELGNSLSFLISDEIDDMQVSHSAIQGKLRKLGKDLSNVLVKVEEISDAVEVLQ